MTKALLVNTKNFFFGRSNNSSLEDVFQYEYNNQKVFVDPKDSSWQKKKIFKELAKSLQQNVYDNNQLDFLQYRQSTRIIINYLTETYDSRSLPVRLFMRIIGFKRVINRFELLHNEFSDKYRQLQQTQNHKSGDRNTILIEDISVKSKVEYPNTDIDLDDSVESSEDDMTPSMYKTPKPKRLKLGLGTTSSQTACVFTPLKFTPTQPL